MRPSRDDSPWSQQVRDRWFFGTLAASVVALVLLFLPFGDVLLLSGTTVVVTWPVYERMLRWLRGRRLLSAVLTTVLLAVAVFGPLSLVVYRFLIEALALAQLARDALTSGQVEAWASDTLWALRVPGEEWLGEWAPLILPEDTDLLTAVLGPLQDALLGAGQALAGLIPQLLGSIASGGIDAVIFVFAVISFYMEGPRVLDVAMKLSPMADAYEQRLFDVFQEFSNNLVVGSLATAALQGVVASIGYSIGGVERVIFVSLLTAVLSFFPIFGTAVVWVPVSLYIGSTAGPGWGLFVAIWNASVTASVDNFVKPMFLRGRSNIHPLLIFLAVFGGLSWMGFSGVLVGPVLVAAFLALYTIYCEDYLGLPEHSPLARLRGETGEIPLPDPPPTRPGTDASSSNIDDSDPGT